MNLLVFKVGGLKKIVYGARKDQVGTWKSSIKPKLLSFFTPDFEIGKIQGKKAIIILKVQAGFSVKSIAALLRSILSAQCIHTFQSTQKLGGYCFLLSPLCVNIKYLVMVIVKTIFTKGCFWNYNPDYDILDMIILQTQLNLYIVSLKPIKILCLKCLSMLIYIA